MAVHFFLRDELGRAVGDCAAGAARDLLLAARGEVGHKNFAVANAGELCAVGRERRIERIAANGLI